jgi:hypothetical protein
MRRDLIAAARQIAGEVRASENQYDLALANNARLVAGLLEARVKAGLPAKIGGGALEQAIGAISHGAKARQMVLEAHEELARLNLRELAVGDVVECPEKWASLEPNVVAFGAERNAA